MSFETPPPSDETNEPVPPTPTFGGPPGYGGPPSFGYGAGQPPNNYLVWAILTTIFCCLPLGVVSIVFSSEVNSKWAMGDAQGALKASNNARNFAIASAVAWIAIFVVIFILTLIGVSVSDTSSSTTSL